MRRDHLEIRRRAKQWNLVIVPVNAVVWIVSFLVLALLDG